MISDKNVLDSFDKERVEEKHGLIINKDYKTQEKLPEDYLKDANQDTSRLSDESPNDKSSSYLLEQVEELKLLLKSRDDLIEKYKEEEFSNTKSRENRKILTTLSKDNLSLVESERVIYNIPHGMQENTESIFASTLMGVNSHHISQLNNPSDRLSFLSFIKKKKKLGFAKNALIHSHLSSFNL